MDTQGEGYYRRKQTQTVQVLVHFERGMTLAGFPWYFSTSLSLRRRTLFCTERWMRWGKYRWETLQWSDGRGRNHGEETDLWTSNQVSKSIIRPNPSYSRSSQLINHLGGQIPRNQWTDPTTKRREQLLKISGMGGVGKKWNPLQRRERCHFPLLPNRPYHVNFRRLMHPSPGGRACHLYIVKASPDSGYACFAIQLCSPLTKAEKTRGGRRVTWPRALLGHQGIVCGAPSLPHSKLMKMTN